MDAGTLITNLLTYTEGVIDTPTDAAFYVNRRRAKFHAQRAVNYVWGYRNWAFKWVTDAAVTVTAGVGDLPSNFLSFGKSGGAFLGAGLPILRWKSPKDMAALRAAIGQSGQPNFYSIAATVPLIGTTGGTRTIYTYPLDTRTLTLVYERKCPTLLDSTLPEDAADLATYGSGLEEIPEPWHLSVIYEGTVYFSMLDKGNALAAAQMGIWKAGLKQMCEVEHTGLEAEHNLVPYSARRI